MAYEIYFNDILFPIAPEKITTEIKNRNKTVDLINDGEVNILKDVGLTKISFSLLLPNQKYPFARYDNGFKPAEYYTDILWALKDNKLPFLFKVIRVLPNGEELHRTEIIASLESYNIEDSVKNGFDFVADIQLLQYKPYGTESVPLEKISKKKKRPKSKDITGVNYTIKSGDTLWNIAKKFYGDGSKWTGLYEYNKTVIEKAAKAHGKASSSNGHWIYSGTVIFIPNVTSLPKSTAKKTVQSAKKSQPNSIGGGGRNNTNMIM